MFGVGAPELFLIFLIVLLVFGAKRLPEIARSLGKATQEFKRAKSEFTNIANEPPAEPPAATPAATALPPPATPSATALPPAKPAARLGPGPLRQ
jgi:sec-independent protein translocase protein TatA